MKTLIFIANQYFYNGDGYTSRILMEMQLLSSKYKIILFLPDNINEINLPDYLEVEKYKIYGKNRYFFILNKISMKRSLTKLLKKNNDAVICAESLFPALDSYKIVKKFGNKMIFDCHGIEPVEFALNHPSIIGKIYSLKLKYEERKMLKKIDFVITVTNKQFEYWNMDIPNMVLPMLPSQQFLIEENYKKKIRKELFLPQDANVFLYCGQNQKWQMCEETIKYYSEFYNEKDNWLLIYTRQKTFFEELIKKYGIINYRVITVPYENINQYLDACDYGFCIRNSSIINQVASPTKVLEYVSRNVMPILTEYVGDFSSELYKNKLAIVVDDLNKETIIKNSIEGNMGREYVLDLFETKSSEYLHNINYIFSKDKCNKKDRENK